MAESILAPCPFCGAHAETDFIPEHSSYAIECYSVGCAARIICESPEEAIAAWNRRAVPAGDYLDGVNIPRLREALTFLGRGNGIGEGDVAANLSEYVNAITRGVLACKELLRSGVPAGWKLVPAESSEKMQRAMAAQFNGTAREAMDAWAEALAAAPDLKEGAE